MRIRLATKSDIQTLVRLYIETINSSPLVHTYIKRNIISETVYVLINEQDEIKGMYIYSMSRLLNPYELKRSSRTFCWLDQICVWPSDQCKGYGTELMKHYLKLSTSDNRLVCLPPMETYYKQFGFIRESIIVNENHNQLIMVRNNVKENI